VTHKRFAELLCTTAGTKLPRYDMDPGRLAWLGRINEWFAAVTGKKPYFSSKSMTYLGGRYIYFDISKARSELGYDPTSLEETVVESVRWFAEERERVLAGEVVHPVCMPADRRAAATNARRSVDAE